MLALAGSSPHDNWGRPIRERTKRRDGRWFLRSRWLFAPPGGKRRGSVLSRIQASHKGYFGTLLLAFTERGLRSGSDVRDTISAALASLRVSASGSPYTDQMIHFLDVGASRLAASSSRSTRTGSTARRAADLAGRAAGKDCPRREYPVLRRTVEQS